MAFIDNLTGQDDLILQEYFQHKRFGKCVLRDDEDKFISRAASSIAALLCYKIVNFAEHKMVEENNHVASCGHCESNHSLDFNVNSCGQKCFECSYCEDCRESKHNPNINGDRSRGPKCFGYNQYGKIAMAVQLTTTNSCLVGLSSGLVNDKDLYGAGSFVGSSKSFVKGKMKTNCVVGDSTTGFHCESICQVKSIVELQRLILVPLMWTNVIPYRSVSSDWLKNYCLVSDSERIFTVLCQFLDEDLSMSDNKVFLKAEGDVQLNLNSVEDRGQGLNLNSVCDRNEDLHVYSVSNQKKDKEIVSVSTHRGNSVTNGKEPQVKIARGFFAGSLGQENTNRGIGSEISGQVNNRNRLDKQSIGRTTQESQHYDQCNYVYVDDVISLLENLNSGTVLDNNPNLNCKSDAGLDLNSVQGLVDDLSLFFEDFNLTSDSSRKVARNLNSVGDEVKELNLNLSDESLTVESEHSSLDFHGFESGF